MDKISGLILAHEKLKRPKASVSADDHAAQLWSAGVDPTRLDAEECALYVEERLSEAEIAELALSGIEVHEVYVPPLEGKHPYGFHLTTVPYASLDAIRADHRFVRLESTEVQARPLNDLSGVMTNADDVHAGNGVTSYTGDGVRIAVADSGVDLTHPDLPTPIEAFDVTDGTSVLDWGVNVANTVSNHGTHVSGTVLGRGTLSGGQYKGSAPDASFYFYKIGNDVNASASFTDMIEAIFRALEVGVDVFSMSYGGFTTHMDGSNAAEQAVDVAVSEGMACFISAGNERNDQAHDSVFVSPSTSSQTVGYVVNNTFNTQPLSLQLLFNVVWRDSAEDDLNVTMGCTNLGAGESLSLPFGSFSSRGTESQLYFLNINVSALTEKTYDFVFSNSANSGGAPRVHVYDWSGVGAFEIADPGYTVGSPALADDAMAVGAWTHRDVWQNYVGDFYTFSSLFAGSLAPFSSIGPRIDNVRKPNFVSPGAATISLRESVPGLATVPELIVHNTGVNDGNLANSRYYVLQGTSMATPYAAGIAALFLEADPTLDPDALYALIELASSNYNNPNSSVGYGLIDALIGIQEISGVPPIIRNISDRSIDDGQFLFERSYLSQGRTGTTWSIIAPSVRPGNLGINSFSGQVTWTADFYDGPLDLTIQATNAFGSDQESWRVEVDPVEPLIRSVDDVILDDQSYYSRIPELTRGTGPFTWSLLSPVSPPGDMQIDSATGELTWSVDFSDAPIDVTVETSGLIGTDTESWTISVIPVAPTINAVDDVIVGDGLVYRFTPGLVRGSNPTTWHILSPAEPPGDMAIDVDTGELTWTAEFSEGSVDLTIVAFGPAGSDTESWTIGVEPTAPVIVPVDDVVIPTGNIYDIIPHVTSGTVPLSWTLVAPQIVPAGMNFNSNNGRITWTTDAAVSPLGVTVRASGPGGASSESWTINVTQNRWVDFGSVAGGNGTVSSPYSSLSAAVAAAGIGDGITIRGDTGVSHSNESLVITKPLVLEAHQGSVSIGTLP